MYWHILCHFYAFDAFNVYNCVYYSCISRISHYLLTNFAPIKSHKIALISCDNRIKSQNTVWIQKKISLRGVPNTNPIKWSSTKYQPTTYFLNTQPKWDSHQMYQTQPCQTIKYQIPGPTFQTKPKVTLTKPNSNHNYQNCSYTRFLNFSNSHSGGT